MHGPIFCLKTRIYTGAGLKRLIISSTVFYLPSGTLSTVKNDDIFLCFATGTYSDILASWFFIHYRKSVTSNTFQFRDDSESKSAINRTFCGHRLHWFKKIKSDLLFSNVEWNYNREREKSKYLDNISVLPTSIFIFDKFVDDAQPEVADEIAGTFWEHNNLTVPSCTVALYVV